MSAPDRPRCVVVVRPAEARAAAAEEPAPAAPTAAPEPAPAAGGPRLATPEEVAAAAAWSPPPTWADRFSDASRRAIRAATIALGAAVLAVAVGVGVPAFAVTRSPGYAPARTRLEADLRLRSFLGVPLRCDRLPVLYRLGEDEARYVFRVRGPLGWACGEVTTRGAAVGRVRVSPSSEVPDAWWRGAR